MQLWRCFLALFLMVLPAAVSAEIVWVDIYWTEACSATCAKMIEQRLAAVVGVAHVQVFPSEGRARMQWRPNSKMDYMMLKSAVAWVGVDISDMLVEVRGKIQSGSSNMVLTSTGDGTRFALLGVPKVSTTQMTNWENVASYPLSQDQRRQLWEAKQQNQVVTIQGPLFQFWNPPPLNLIVSTMKIGEGKESTFSTRQLPPQAPYRVDPWHGQPNDMRIGPERFKAPPKDEQIVPNQRPPLGNS